MPAKFGSLWQVIGMADAWVLSFFPSPEAFWAFYAFLWLLLLAFACFSMMPRAKLQEGRTRRCCYRRNQENRRVWTLHKCSWCKRKQCLEHGNMDGLSELAKLFNRNLEDLNRYIEMLNLELPEDSSESTTSDTESETSCSSGTSLDSWSTISCTTITESETGQNSWASTPTPVQKEDWLHASAVQPGLVHPKAGPGEQHDHDTRPRCRKEVVGCHRASSVHQHQQHVQVQQAAPSHPPEVPKFHSTKLKAPLPQKETQETQETLDCFTAKKKEEEKLRLPADGDKPPQDDPASASKISKRAEKPILKVVPMVRDLPCVDKTVEGHPEGPDVQKQTQRLFRLPRKILASMKRFFDHILGKKDSQTEDPQRNTRQRHRLPFRRFQQHAHTTKSAVQLSVQTPGPQQEAAAPKDAFTRGMQEPVHSVPAAVLRGEQGMKPQEDGDRSRQKMACGGRANGSSTASKTTLPGTSKKNRGPGAVGDSPSTQAEQASPQSKGAPWGQSDKKGEGPSISTTGDMGTPAPPRRRSPQRKNSSNGERPSALPRPPHHIWICLDMPHMTKVLVAPRDCRKAKHIAKYLHKLVLASQSEQLPDNAGQPRIDPAAEGTGAVPRRRHRGARKDKGCSQDRPVFARLRPKCIKAPSHTLVPKESIWGWPSPEAFRGSMGCQATWR
ncbi:uncharacterized protein [Anser cygnoides]|uniref:uncharacterized protein isoform X2 n=1 Tax=Anser cygnoides TaxID=8845 RepID=UPI0034D36533